MTIRSSHETRLRNLKSGFSFPTKHSFPTFPYPMNQSCTLMMESSRDDSSVKEQGIINPSLIGPDISGTCATLANQRIGNDCDGERNSCQAENYPCSRQAWLITPTTINMIRWERRLVCAWMYGNLILDYRFLEPRSYLHFIGRLTM